MDNFTLHMPTKVIFGRGTETGVGQEVRKHSGNILLHYGGGSIKRTGLYDRVVESLEKAGIKFAELGGVVPNPRLSMVRKGIELCRKEGIDFILAVGGGSVIDSSKAIAAGAPYEGDVWDFFTKKTVIKNPLKVGVILTISAAGSEMSPSMVITNEEGGRKLSARSDLSRPVFSILNPELTFTLPKKQIAYGSADMFAHIVERYFTNTKNVDVTDEMCEAVMRSIIRNSKKAVADPKDYDAQAELMWAGTVAHNGILGTGREEDWASHKIEHELSAAYDIAHGAGLAVIIPAWMKYVYKHDTARFARYGRNVFHVFEKDDEKAALMGIKETEKFFSSLGLETTLKGLGIGGSRFEEMSRLAAKPEPIGNFVSLDAGDIVKIYRLALG
ncbi:MAG: iron-containing alcohol dehydrogenase [Candidatus Aenigmarchaeota archaeon]|nr:iron-containing alcohol dehydrogenase [Candidatus Aenigmarchaeota archaeon]